jgi:hypothetical protein
MLLSFASTQTELLYVTVLVGLRSDVAEAGKIGEDGGRIGVMMDGPPEQVQYCKTTPVPMSFFAVLGVVSLIRTHELLTVYQEPATSDYVGVLTRHRQHSLNFAYCLLYVGAPPGRG